MLTDKIRKYILPNMLYLFVGWACLKLGTYRLAAGAGFGEKLLGLAGVSARPLQTLHRGSIPLIGWWALWGR